MRYENISGVPEFESAEYREKHSDVCVLIPVLNEAGRISEELERAAAHGIPEKYDVILCDGNSTDGSTEEGALRALGVNTLLVKLGAGKQGAQLRMGFWWAMQRGYMGFVTIDGNNKDSIEDIPAFAEKLAQGYDFVQGSRFIEGGHAINTPTSRYLAVRLIHAPVISLTAGKHYTDTTNAYRAYSLRYLSDPGLQPFRHIFDTYELLAYLSVRADQLDLRTCEIPVTRAYPKGERAPTKISPLKGNWLLLKILFANLCGEYWP